MTGKKDKFAIVNSIKTSHKAIAICDYATYDLIGDGDGEGYSVNDTYWTHDVEFPATLHISNVPDFPGAKDNYREFPKDSSFNTEILCSFELDIEKIQEIFGIDAEDNGTGDGEHYYFDDENGNPLGEIYVKAWKTCEESE